MSPGSKHSPTTACGSGRALAAEPRVGAASASLRDETRPRERPSGPTQAGPRRRPPRQRSLPCPAPHRPGAAGTPACTRAPPALPPRSSRSPPGPAEEAGGALPARRPRALTRAGRASQAPAAPPHRGPGTCGLPPRAAPCSPGLPLPPGPGPGSPAPPRPPGRMPAAPYPRPAGRGRPPAAALPPRLLLALGLAGSLGRRHDHIALGRRRHLTAGPGWGRAAGRGRRRKGRGWRCPRWRRAGRQERRWAGAGRPRDPPAMGRLGPGIGAGAPGTGARAPGTAAQGSWQAPVRPPVEGAVGPPGLAAPLPSAAAQVRPHRPLGPARPQLCPGRPGVGGSARCPPGRFASEAWAGCGHSRRLPRPRAAAVGWASELPSGPCPRPRPAWAVGARTEQRWPPSPPPPGPQPSPESRVSQVDSCSGPG